MFEHVKTNNPFFSFNCYFRCCDGYNECRRYGLSPPHLEGKNNYIKEQISTHLCQYTKKKKTLQINVYSEKDGLLIASVFKKFIEILPESRWFPAGKDWVKIVYL